MFNFGQLLKPYKIVAFSFFVITVCSIAFLYIYAFSIPTISQFTLNPQISNITSKVEAILQLDTIPGMNGAILPSDKKFAYAYYITDDNYACAALVAASELIRLKKSPKVDIVFIFIENMISDSSVNALQTLDPSSKTKMIKAGTQLRTRFLEKDGYYRDCMTKIEIFGLIDYDRVIFADADGIPLHNLDHLFLLPTVELASPRAYWLGNPGFFTSDFAVVQPNNNTYNTLVAKLNSGEDVRADMDLMNAELGMKTMLLPGQYTCLNGHWEDRNLEAFKDRVTDLEELYYEYCQYMHFTSVAKPWNVTPERAKRDRPKAHPLFAKQFEYWWSIANNVCPRYSKEAKIE